MEKTNIDDLPEIPRITKAKFMEKYEQVKDSENLAVNLFIHMPDDSTEIIFNPNKKLVFLSISALANGV